MSSRVRTLKYPGERLADGKGGRGGGRGGRGGGASRPDERKKRENILNLALYVDKSIRVKFAGGREGESCAGLWIDGGSGGKGG